MKQAKRPFHLLAFEEAHGFGGAFIDLRNMAAELRRRDVTVSVARSYGGDCWADEAFDGLRLLSHSKWRTPERLGLAGRPARLGAYALETAASVLPQALRYAAWARLNGVGAVFLNNNLTENVVGALAARLAGLPILAYFQGRERSGFLTRRLIRWVEHPFSVSEHVSRSIVAAGGDPAKIRLLHPGIEAPDPGRRERREEKGEKIRVGMVGMWTPWKGQTEFLDGFALAAGREPRLEAWLFGRPVPGQEAYAEKIESKIAGLGLADRVRLVRDRSRPEEIYPETDLTVHASIEPEPFGRVIIEAMSHGLPVIAAEEGGAAEILREGITGFAVDPRRADALADRMLRLARDAELRRRMGEAARRDALARFSYPAVLSPLFHVLDEIRGAA